jgi:hypothetical protein
MGLVIRLTNDTPSQWQAKDHLASIVMPMFAQLEPFSRKSASHSDLGCVRIVLWANNGRSRRFTLPVPLAQVH